MKHFLYNDVSIISVWNFIDRKDSGHIFTKKKKIKQAHMHAQIAATEKCLFPYIQ